MESVGLTARIPSVNPDQACSLWVLPTPPSVDLDTAWTQFSMSRVHYEYVAYQLAYILNVIPAPWSGERKSKFDAIWPTSSVDIYEENITQSDPPTGTF